MTTPPKKLSPLASAMQRSGATIAGTPAPQPPAETEPEAAPAPRRASTVAPSRLGMVPITVHTVEAVRRQLKAIAAEEGRSMEDVAAEAFNLLFAKYRRPEIAPRKTIN